MLARRIIPCLDCDLGVPDGRVVKGIEFRQIRYAGVPWELATRYYEDGADEIVFLDITASHERRATMFDVIRKTSEHVFVPLTVGGGISSLEDARKAFSAGADKVTVNTAALRRPELIREIAESYGSQAVVVAIDAKRRYQDLDGRITINTESGRCWFECSYYGGRRFTGVDALAWARRVEELGAGEILLTSMDRDGTYDGFDIELTEAVSRMVRIPVIASGGCASPEHMYEVFRRTDASAALAASIFHFNQWSIRDCKRYLHERGINVRITD
ncbi:MAG: imidazole glycerol phosphate synthase subunit HisF [Methanothrix sp.]|uniref:imidazole glycerol phosphate synthase subunit HisF n=1 Tax=Methanothrix sp. TaxID=90426 RepID=UPI003168DFE9|nr:imidazole glycerol phosphate synthase subunit HisF [Methanothrix sp.]